MTNTAFQVIPSTIKKLAAGDDGNLGWGWSKM